MDKKQARINKILSLFSKKEYLSCKQIADLLEVSEMTIRRDISTLQESNMVTRGAKAGTFTLTGINTHPKEDYNILDETVKNAQEKNDIGQFAATLINPGDTIIVDTGTTTVRMAHYIPMDMRFTALCYNYDIFQELLLRKNAEIMLTGGIINQATMSFSSEEGIQIINKFRANKFFMSASGVHEKLGLTCGYRTELPNKQAAINSSLTKILLADSSKFGTVRAAYFSALNDIDTIVTDSQISPEWKNTISSLGIKLYIV